MHPDGQLPEALTGEPETVPGDVGSGRVAGQAGDVVPVSGQKRPDQTADRAGVGTRLRSSDGVATCALTECSERAARGVTRATAPRRPAPGVTGR
jgi:hypothetical protein